MAALSDPITLRGVVAKNRVMIPPMAMYQAVDGFATDWHLVHYGRFAMGGAGIVMLESCAVEERGRITHACLGLWSDEHIEPLRRIAAFIGSRGGVPAIQLNHSGRKGSWRRPWDGYGPLTVDDLRARGEAPWPVAGPSPLPVNPAVPPPAELDAAQLSAIRDSWVAAARRTRAAGFGLLELHAAHGYLLHQFLSPIANHRTDRYGADLAGRMRFPLEVVEAVRAVWPDELPLAVRVSAVDGVEDGWSIEDTVVLARELKARGVDLVDCSSGGIGGLATVTRIPRGPGFQVGFAEQVRREAGVPTVAVGLITTAAQAADVLRDERADIVAVGRQALVDPNWPDVAGRELSGHGDYRDWPQEIGWWLDKREESLRASR